MLGAVDAVDSMSRVSVDAADLLMVSSLASTKRVEHGSFAAGPPPSPVHGASQAMLIDDRPGWASDLCSTDGHVLLRKRGARYKMCSTAQLRATCWKVQCVIRRMRVHGVAQAAPSTPVVPRIASMAEDPP